ncbi:MAG: peptidase M23 [Clostridia bacterium]|nr:peptidase M23 [Clostridia bacterium]
MEKTEKFKTKMKVFCCFLIFVVFCALFFTNFGYATNSEKDELDKINDQIDDIQSELNQGKKKASELQAEIKSLEKGIYSAEVELNSLQKNINSSKVLIAQALRELASLEEDISKQNDGLNARLRTMYKNGEVGILTVLLGSSDMSDFMTNLDMVQRIYDNDATILESLQQQYAEVIDQKIELQTLKDQLLSQQEEESERQEALKVSKGTVQSKKSEIDADNAVLSQQIDALNAEANALTAKILGLQGSGNYIGGTMTWPSQASTRVSSPFGNRLHPILRIYKLHTGIDIAASSGTNILAANAGTVISAGWNNSYGYMVMVDHGGGIVTLYAHSSKLLVSKGNVVARGQVIAKIGSTGMSTGPHLHFEVRVNGVYKNPLDYVSP